MKIVVNTCVLILLNLSFTRGQQRDYYLPLSYESTSSTSIHNPSLINLEKDWKVQAIFQGRTGSFSNVYNAGLKADIKVNDIASDHESILGLNILNEKENGFISKTRAHLAYVRRQKLAEEMFLSLGTYLGVYNFLLKSSNVVEGASALTIDGDVGINMEIRNSAFGAGIAQMFNSTFVLISTENKLKRYYQLHVIQKIDFSPDYAAELGGFYFLNREDAMYQGFLKVTYAQKFFAEADYIDNRGLTMTLGAEMNLQQERKFALSFSSILLADRTLRSSAARYQLVLSIF